jgi:hypothetical protein
MDDRTLELIHGELDGELDVQERAVLQARLEASPEARREYGKQRALHEALARLPDFDPPPGLRDSIVAAAHRAASAPVTVPRGRRRGGLGLIAALAATVAGVALIVGRESGIQELDPSALAGTLGRPAIDARTDAGDPAAALRLREYAANGAIMLHRGQDGTAIEIDLDTPRAIEIIARPARGQLELKGFVRIDGAPAESGVVDRGVRVLHVGRQHYVLVLHSSEPAAGIELAVYDGKRLVASSRLNAPGGPPE